MSKKKRNHFIPRVLLNRFSSRSEPAEAKYWVWTFSQASQIKEVSTKDVAVSKYFYGNPIAGLEDKFSVVERELGKTLSAIDSGDSPQTFKNRLSNFAWMQAWRTRSFRTRFSNTFSEMMIGLSNGVHSQAAKQHLIVEAERYVEEKFKEIPAEKVAELTREFGGLSPIEYFKAQMRDAIHAGALSGEMQRILQAMSAPAMAEKIAADGLNKGLGQILDGDISSPAIFEVDWELGEIGEGSLLLSDSALFCVGSDGWVSPVNDAISWEILVFPISSKKYLVGKRKPNVFDWNADQINAASATCSVHQFFAATAGSEFTKLVSLIGSRSEMLRPEEKVELMGSIWSQPKKN
jgi:hypothetical protein